MKRNQITANLCLDEYIPKELYLKYEKNPMVLAGLIDCQMVRADPEFSGLRNQFGPVTIPSTRDW